MKKEINKKLELIAEIKNAYNEIDVRGISNMIESFASKLVTFIKINEFEFHINSFYIIKILF